MNAPLYVLLLQIILICKYTLLSLRPERNKIKGFSIRSQPSTVNNKNGLTSSIIYCKRNNSSQSSDIRREFPSARTNNAFRGFRLVIMFTQDGIAFCGHDRKPYLTRLLFTHKNGELTARCL